MKQQLIGAQGASSGEINSLKQQINIYITEMNNYKIQITQLQNDNLNLKQQLQGGQGALNGEINGLKQQINIYVTEINTYKQQINTYMNEINNLKQQIGILQS